MKFYNYLTEKVTKNVIVVDIQPMYEKWISFDLEQYTDFLLEQRNILYFYNGPDTVGEDTKEDIINWLSEINPDIYNKLVNDTIWIDKGYAFFRSWMDEGADIGFIKQAIRFMNSKKVYDSRDIEPEEWENEFPDDWEDSFEDDSINLPDIPINKLKKFSGSYIVGGGRNECLKELQLLMSVFNINAKEVKKFIY